eukprot:5961052-Amphidinium_carterae.1
MFALSRRWVGERWLRNRMTTHSMWHVGPCSMQADIVDPGDLLVSCSLAPARACMSERFTKLAFLTLPAQSSQLGVEFARYLAPEGWKPDSNMKFLSLSQR